MVMKGVSCCCLWRVLKWVNVHQFPEFLRIVSCCHTWRVLKWVNVHYFTKFSQMVLKGVSLYCFCLDSSCPFLFCMVMYCCICAFSASALAAWGDILLDSMVNSLLHSMGISPLSMEVSLGCWVLLGSLVDSPLLCSMEISPLPVGVSLGCWGSLGLSVCWLLGSVFLRLGLFGCAGPAHCVSPSPCLWLISCLKQNLKHLLVPCHNLLSLPWSTHQRSWKNRFVICFLYGLKGRCLTDLMSCVLEGNLFPPRLTHGLEGSLSACVFDCVFDSFGITLSSGDSYAFYTRCLERSQLMSVLLISTSYVGWGLERSLSACFSNDSYTIYIKGFKRNQLVLLSPAFCVGWGLERSLGAYFSNDSYAIYIKGLERSLCACTHSHGLERTGWMVLKGLWCSSLVPPFCFAIYFQAIVLKGIFGAGVCLVFYVLKQTLETFLHKTWTRPSLELAACPTMMSLCVLVSTT